MADIEGGGGGGGAAAVLSRFQASGVVVPFLVMWWLCRVCERAGGRI